MSEKTKETSSAFIKGALILGVSGIVVKIMGAFFRIPLTNLIGSQGMGYYGSAYPVYVFFITVATAGFPAALGRLIAEKKVQKDYNNMAQTFRTGMIIMFVIGFIGTLFMFLGAKSIVGVIKNPLALYSFWALAPSILLVSMMAVYRGLFQGVQNMKPFAASQLIEQMGRVFLGLFLATLFLPSDKSSESGMAFAAAGATFGATVGAFFGLVIIYMMYRLFRSSNKKYFTIDPQLPVSSKKDIAKEILRIAVPITIGASVMPLMNNIDVALVMNRLIDIGFTKEQANETFGLLSGFVSTLINLPIAITSAIQISIVPAVAASFVKKEAQALKTTVESGVRMALVIGMPATVGFMVLSEPILKLLYPFQEASVKAASSILFVFAPAVIFLGLFLVTTGILQGLDLQTRPAINLFIGAVVKVILTYILVGIPAINVNGAALSSVAAYAVATLLNLLTLKKRAHIRFNLVQVVVKPLISSLGMGLVVYGVYFVSQMILSSNKATFIAMVFGVGVYGYMLLATGTLTDKDIQMMPGGGKIKKIKQFLMAKKLIPVRKER